MMTTDHRFNNTKSNRRIFFFFFFFFRWLLHHACHLTPTTTDNTGNHRQDRKPPQNTPATSTPKKQTFFFFSPEGVPVYIKRSTRYCPCGLCPHGQCCRQQEKNPMANYPEIETSSDTKLRIVGGRRWRLPPLYIIQPYLT
jgi:hypothetical protein